jgi:hypothetical protein
MHGHRFLRPLLVVTGAWLALSCRKLSAEELIGKESTVAERATEATFYWNIEADGDARLVVKNSAGEIVKEGVTGQLSFSSDAVSESKTVQLAPQGKSGVLLADGPKLDREVTEVKYAVLVDGKPVTGALHVPATGTEGLSAAAKQSAGAEDKGPNGGTIQVVGEQRYEVVGDAGSGQVRAYLLGTDAKRPKKLRLGVDAKSPKLVELVWNDEGYYVADIGTAAPRKLTLVVVDHDERPHVVVLGHRADAVILVDAQPRFWARRGWHPGLARGHYKGTAAGPPGQNKTKLHVKPAKGGASKVQAKSK